MTKSSKFADWPFFLVLFLILGAVFGLLSYLQSHTEQAAQEWATRHHGEFQSCQHFGRNQLVCSVRTPDGTYSLVYGLGSDIPAIVNKVEP